MEEIPNLSNWLLWAVIAILWLVAGLTIMAEHSRNRHRGLGSFHCRECGLALHNVHIKTGLAWLRSHHCN